jgi:hypothetical protein
MTVNANRTIADQRSRVYAALSVEFPVDYNLHLRWRSRQACEVLAICNILNISEIRVNSLRRRSPKVGWTWQLLDSVTA